MKHEFQTKYCMLDLTKFIFQYAKSTSDQPVQIFLKDIKDVKIEPDPSNNN